MCKVYWTERDPRLDWVVLYILRLDNIFAVAKLTVCLLESRQTSLLEYLHLIDISNRSLIVEDAPVAAVFIRNVRVYP